MNPMVFSVIAGFAFGVLAVGIMLPMDFPDKTNALLGAFTSRSIVGIDSDGPHAAASVGEWRRCRAARQPTPMR
jgi:hypothetical protein